MNHGSQDFPSARKHCKVVDRNKAYPAMDAMKLVKQTRHRQVRRIGGRCRQPGHRCQEVRPDGARLGGAAGRYRQEGARRGVCAGRQGRSGQGAPGADIVGLEDLRRAQSRRGKMDFDVVIATPGHHARRRPAGPDSRPARPDAEPESGHRDAGCGDGGERTPKPARCSTAPTRPASCNARSVVLRYAGERCRKT